MRQLAVLTTLFALAASSCDDSSTAIIDAAGADSRGADASAVGPLDLPRSIDLGAGDCGGMAQAMVTLTNPAGAADVAISFASSDPAFAVTPAAVTILAGTSTTFTVTAQVPATAIAGAPLTAMLTVTTDIPGHTTESVTATATTRGAQIGISPPSINFGDVPLGTNSTLSFVVSNTGNGATNLGFRPLSNPDFTITFGTNGFADLLPGALVSGSVRYAPTGTGADLEVVPLELGGGPRCGTPPSTLRLSGSGSTTGGVLVSGAIDFGDVACGATSTDTQSITINNTSSITATFTATLPVEVDGDHLRYTVTPASGTVAPGTMATLTVTRLAIATPFAPRVVDAVVRVVANGVPTDVPVRHTQRGPFLTTSAVGQVDFGFQQSGSTTDAPIRVTNGGNGPATLAIVATGDFASALPATIAAGAFADGALRYNPPAGAPVTATITIDAVGACSGPISIPVAGGDGPFPVITPAATFATCPPPAALTTNLSVNNIGTQPLSMNCVEDVSGGPSGLTPVVTPNPIMAPAGGSAFATIDHGPGPGGAGAVTATLACTTNEPLTNQRTTTLTRTLDGAELVLTAPVPLDFVCFVSDTKGWSTRNDGTQSASLSPVTDIGIPLSLIFDFSTVDPASETFHTITAYGGSGAPFRLAGSGDPCINATGSGGLIFAGTVGVDVGSGSGGACSVTPPTLPVRLFDYVGSAH
ncbi:MAG: choice-of-anchor D domain-containing protein [Myxococcales bacterium]|nr:choice-of-anchor D domain-containing protein [Myxococcales bacterium]